MSNDYLASYGAPYGKTYCSLAKYGADIPASAIDELGDDYATVLVSADGVTIGEYVDSEDAITDYAGRIVKTITTEALTVEVPIISNTDITTTLIETTLYSQADNQWTIVLTTDGGLDSDGLQIIRRRVYYRVTPISIDAGTLTRDNAIVHTVTFRALYDTTHSAYYAELEEHD